YLVPYIVQLKVLLMSRLHFDQDIQPLSDFRAGAASFIRQINETRRPIVITQRGKGVAVVVDVAEYESMQEKIELLEEVQKAEAQLSAGLGLSNSDARAQILKVIKP
ncbi:MAG: antitoxin YefM, partial [Colwellia sp.]